MRTLVTGAFLVLATAALGQTPNGATVLKECATTQGAPTDSCKSYINGVVTGVLIDQVAKEQGAPICVPPRVRTEQVIAAVSGFIAAHPNLWTTDGNAVVGVALQTAFPCK